MLLLMPPADVTEAPPFVAVKVWTRDNAASNRVHPAGLRSGTTRNWMGSLTLDGGSADAEGGGDCCVVHPAMTAANVARTHIACEALRMGFSLSLLPTGRIVMTHNLKLRPTMGPYSTRSALLSFNPEPLTVLTPSAR